jgi:hypothetical protein
MHGYHYYNSDALAAGATHVRQTLLKNLLYGTVELPIDTTKKEKFTMSELGIGFPILATDYDLERNFEVKNPNYRAPKVDPSGTFGVTSTPAPAEVPEKTEGDVVPGWKVTRYKFVVQFVWQEKPLRMRLEEKQKAAEEAAKAAANQPPAAPGAAPPGAAPVVVPLPSNTPPAAAPPAGAAPGAPAAPPANAATPPPMPPPVAPGGNADPNAVPPAAGIPAAPVEGGK